MCQTNIIQKRAMHVQDDIERRGLSHLDFVIFIDLN
jgi:hypothetical protein